MLKIKKFGAIDIGSNAMRLLISNVVDNGERVDFNKVSLIRLPIRLGQEAFTDKKLQPEILQKFIDGMKAFKTIMDIYDIEDYMAVATSAMREVENSSEVVELVKKESGIAIQIIDGKIEADIIFNAHFKNPNYLDSNYVYVDVGGGSTEITILSGQKILASKSFKVGTVRMLNNMVSEELWASMKSWVKKETKNLEHVEMIGSGGSVNKIYKILKMEYPKPILYHEFKGIKQTLERMTFDERMSYFKLNQDRADVIVPASKVYYSVMKWADISILHVPKIGLSDGIVQMLYKKSLTDS